jgi:hypothetical protein
MSGIPLVRTSHSWHARSMCKRCARTRATSRVCFANVTHSICVGYARRMDTFAWVPCRNFLFLSICRNRPQSTPGEGRERVPILAHRLHQCLQIFQGHDFWKGEKLWLGCAPLSSQFNFNGKKLGAFSPFTASALMTLESGPCQSNTRSHRHYGIALHHDASHVRTWLRQNDKLI